MERSSSFSLCGVCGESADAVHFGAASCRACAAFFRRKVASGKLKQEVVRCSGNCRLGNQILRRLCASCRFKKCISIGMKTSAVLSRMTIKSEYWTNGLHSKNDSLLSQIKRTYGSLQETRKLVFRTESRTPQIANLEDMNAIFEIDCKLITEHFIPFFASLTFIDSDQREVLNSHFKLPFVLLDGAFRSVDSDMHILANGDYLDPQNLEKFYQNPCEKDPAAAKNVTTVMKPYWKLNKLKDHMIQIKVDMAEFMFLTALLYWDFGIPNQSDRCIQVCTQMRSKVLEELTDYEKSARATEDHSLRVGEIVIVLQAVQKSLSILNECRDISMAYNLYGKECYLFKISEAKKTTTIE